MTLLKWDINNNVKVTLHASITSGSTSLIFDKASAPYRDPSQFMIGPGATGILTIMDSETTLTKVEIVTFTSYVDNGNGTVTVGGLARGQDGTVASAFSTGAVITQALTRDSFINDYLSIDVGSVSMEGAGDQTPAVFTQSGNVRTTMFGIGVFNSAIDMVNTEDDKYNPNQYNWQIGSNSDSRDFNIRMLQPGTVENVSYPFTADFAGYQSGEKVLARIPALEVQRLEKVGAVRLKPILGAIAGSTIVDWSLGEIADYNLASSGQVDFVQGGDQTVDATAGYRQVTMMVTIGSSSNPGYAVTWGLAITWADPPPDFSTGNNKKFILDFIYDGVFWYGTVRGVKQF